MFCKTIKKGLCAAPAAGFTLIELLVVVLIIGILSAVALPQYTKAVEKSRATEAIAMLKALRDQQSICLLEHGDDELCFEGSNGQNLFSFEEYGLPSSSDSDCAEPVCGPATKNFTYHLDGQYIGAERRPMYTKYELETTAYDNGNENELNRIACYNSDSSTNWCQAIGFTKNEGGAYFQP